MGFCWVKNKQKLDKKDRLYLRGQCLRINHQDAFLASFLISLLSVLLLAEQGGQQ